MNYRKRIIDYKIYVVKIGTSTLTYPNGRLNFNRISKLANVLSTIRNKGKKIVLVSSGAIAVGTGRLGLKKRPSDLPGKQAAAAIGQAILMKIYQKLFEEHGQLIAQVLLTKDVTTDPIKKQNATNTLDKLLEMNIIPIINENDTVATHEIQFGDNDTLSADVATLVKADLLILLSDIDGLYSANPRSDQSAKLISVVTEINEEIENAASGNGSTFGTGGMVTKIAAVKICRNDGIDTIIANGEEPELIYDIIDGKEIGTLFVSVKSKRQI